DTIRNARRRKCLLRIQMRRSKDPRDDRDIGRFKSFDEGLLEYSPSAGLRSWFEHRPNPRLRITLPYSAQRFFHCGRVMGKIVVYAYSSHFTADFKTALDAFERGQRLLNHIIRNAQFSGDNHDAEGILHVECTRDGNRKVSDERIRSNYIKRHAFVTRLDFRRLPFAYADSCSRNAGKCCRNEFTNNRAVDAGNDQTGLRHNVYQSAKCSLDCVEIGIDIRMVELDVLQQHNPWQVM